MSDQLDGDDPSPAQRLQEMLVGYRLTQMLHVAASLGLADALADGPRSVAELAGEVHARPDPLHRLLRALSGVGVFAEVTAEPNATAPGERRYELNPLAEPLRRDHPDSVHAFAVSYGQPWWWDVFGRLEHTVRTGETAFDHAYGVGFFEYLALHPEAEAIFAANMTATTESEERALTGTYDPGDADTVVDVGGGEGALLARFLAAHPNLRGILYDLPTVIDRAGGPLQAAGVIDRCELRDGDFFRWVPEGADLYLLKDVLHDWSDDRCVEILERCREAMHPGSRLLILERLLPSDGGPSPAALVDINMLVFTGGRERTEEQYRDLLRAAGLRLEHVRHLEPEPSLLEATAA